MVTPFGREVRKRRFERNETQADVARSLGVSGAFWSNIETGRKNVSNELLAKVIRHFGTPMDSDEWWEELAEASGSEIKIDMRKLDEPTRKVVAVFARKVGALSEKQLQRLRSVLET